MSARALQPLTPFAFGLLVVAPDLLAWVLVLLTILWLASRKYASQAILMNQGDTSCRDDHSGHEGEIIAMGDAPYAHDDHNRMSFYITLRSAAGREKTLWGVDLRRVANETNLEIGARVLLAYMGKQAVVVEQDVRDDAGRIIGTRKIRTHRNQWRADVLSIS